jgi:hypothetical protein
MYAIGKTAYGFKLTFGGFMQAPEMQKWHDDMVAKLPKVPSKFGIVVDMRTLKPLPQDAQGILVKGQIACKKAGMERSCVILDNATTTMQFKRLGKESGIYAFERYIDASANAAWESAAVAWVSKGTDPDVK